jgi:hypothetical protein
VKSLIFFLTIALAYTSTNISQGAENSARLSHEKPVCPARYFPNPPAIDGVLVETVWEDAVFCESTGLEETSSLPRLIPFKFAMGYDDSTLYGAFECEIPQSEDPKGIIGSDTILFAIDSLGKERSYFTFSMRRDGGKGLAIRYGEGNRTPERFIHENRGDIPPLSLPGEWEFKATSEKGRWHGEFRIPLRILSIRRPDIYTPIGLNVLRESTISTINERTMETWARMLIPWALNSFSPVNFGKILFLAPEGAIPWKEPDFEANERSIQDWRASDIGFKPAKITRNTKGHDITLGNGVILDILTEGGQFRGVGEVKAMGRNIRNLSHPMEFELWEPDGSKIGTKGFLVKTLSTDGPHAVVELGIPGDNELEGSIELRFAPASEKIGVTLYNGFAYSYRVRTDRKFVGRIVETGTWELDGDAVGCVLHLQSGNINPLNKMEEKSVFRVHADSYLGWNQCFDLMTGKGASLFMGYRTPSLVLTSIAKYPDEHAVHFVNQIIAGRNRDFLTPQREILLAPSKVEDNRLWHEAFDFQSERMRNSAGIRETEVVPTSWLPLPYLFDKRGDYKTVADNEIPKLARLGFKRLILPPIWKSHTGVCVSWDLSIDPKSGGEEGLKYLIAKAHENGMTVVSWLGTALYYRGLIPYFHPEWVAHNLDGSGMDTHYNELRIMNMRSPYYEYFLDSLKKVRDKTGLDGYWIDSWSTFGCHAVDYGVPDARPHMAELLSALSELLKMGYTDILLEGMGPFGISASWLYKGLFDHPEYSYKTSFYGSSFTAEQYYRFLANKSAPHIGQPGDELGVGEKVDKITGEKSYQPDEELLQKGRANLDFNEVYRYMKQCTVLPDGRGMLWTDPETGIHVLFAYKKFNAKTLRPGFITDVTNSKNLGKAKIFNPEPMHTYIFSDKPLQENSKPAGVK